MNNDQKILEAMQRYGGSFASAVAVAAQRADMSNYSRLKAAFPDLWGEYLQLAEQLERNRAEQEREETQ